MGRKRIKQMSHSRTKEPTASKDLLVADRESRTADYCRVIHWTVLRSPLADFCFRRLRRREGRVVLPNSVNPFSDECDDSSSVASLERPSGGTVLDMYQYSYEV